jgi:predicted nicotinamide N-methyase
VANHDNRSLSASKASVSARRLRRLRFGGVETRVYEAVSGRPLGSVVWDGALLLCAHLARRASDSWKSKHVLELGSGTGLVGLALAQRGAAVTLTDLAPLLPLLAANARLNAPETKQDGASEQAVAEMAKDWEKRVRVRELDWTHELDVETTAELRHVDLVVGADLLYVDEPVFSALLRTLQKLAPAEALLAGVRRHKGVDEYLARLRDAFALESLDAELEAVLVGLQERKSNVEGGWSLRSGEGAYLVRLRARK